MTLATLLQNRRTYISKRRHVRQFHVDPSEPIVQGVEPLIELKYLDSVVKLKQESWLKRTFRYLLRQNTPRYRLHPWKFKYEELQDLKLVGFGAEGQVFSCRYRGSTVAIKKVKKPEQTNIKHLKRLCHPNLVRFRGVCLQKPNYCLMMDFCPLGHLYAEIHRDKEITMETRLQWAADIASGMNYLHSNRVIHLDLKTPNILIGRSGILKVADFGLSKSINDGALPITFIGTVRYMAPELIRQTSLTEKVDIWAYGVVIWEILTRKTPYEGKSEPAVIYGVGSNTFRLEIPDDCPKGFEVILQDCWNERPYCRPSFRRILIQLDQVAEEVIADVSFAILKKSRKILWKDGK